MDIKIINIKLKYFNFFDSFVIIKIITTFIYICLKKYNKIIIFIKFKFKNNRYFLNLAILLYINNKDLFLKNLYTKINFI